MSLLDKIKSKYYIFIKKKNYALMGTSFINLKKKSRTKNLIIFFLKKPQLMRKEIDEREREREREREMKKKKKKERSWCWH